VDGPGRLYTPVIIIEMRSAPSVVLLALSLCLPACSTSGPTGPTSAALTIDVTPNPVVVRLRCAAGGGPPCFVSLDPTITLRETAGLGGHMESMDVTVRDLGTSVETKLTLGHDWIVTQAGSDRIEAMSTRSFHAPVADYPIQGTRPNFALIFTVRFVDDEANVLTPTVQINVTG
jgi:hypothetical protein